MKKITIRTLITVKMLQEAEICGSQIMIFAKEWPKGTRCTKKACLRAGELWLNLQEFGVIFLPTKLKNKFLKIERKAYQDYRICWEDYMKIVASALYQVLKEDNREKRRASI